LPKSSKDGIIAAQNHECFLKNVNERKRRRREEGGGRREEGGGRREEGGGRREEGGVNVRLF
jgi:hypothetical protein